MNNEKEQEGLAQITNEEEIKENNESMGNTTNLNKPKPKKLTLKNDVIFQAFFSRKGNEKYLIDFLNAILKINIVKIEIREEVNLEKLSVGEKGGRLDIQAELNEGTIVNIEMQMKNLHNIENRTTLYGAKVLAREEARGKNYNDIKNVIMINILNYELTEFEEYVSETVVVLDKHREYEIIKGMKWYFIELPKFRKAHPNMDEKLNQWLAFIDDNDRGKIKMAEKKNKTLEKARKEMTYLTGDEEIRRLAELREKWEMDWNSSMDYSKREGIKEGKKEGIKEGAKEKNLENAKKMREEKIPIETIMKITKLTQEEIENL